MSRKILALATTLSSASACMLDEAFEDATDLRSESTSSCSTWRCGYNAAEINGESLSELHLGGLANASGAKIVGFVAPQNVLSYKLTVERDEFVARGPLGTLSGAGLVGSTILIKLGSGLVVPVAIARRELISSWAAGAAPVTAYTLVYADPFQPLGQSNVCSGTLLDPLTAAVTLIGGETYDAAKKTVNPGKTGWFTLACAGAAAAKMKLMNYGPNSDFDGHGAAATVAQRQSTLKMITADYCGDGVSYTANGTPLLWTNAEGTVTPDPAAPVGAFEAAWGSSGAYCLDTPRHPELAATLHCSLPACTDAHRQAGEWITENPGA